MKIICALSFSLILCQPDVSFAQSVTRSDIRSQFKNPDAEYRPIFPILGAGGAKIIGGQTVRAQLENIYGNFDFGGVMFAPNDSYRFSGKPISDPSYLKHIGSGLQRSLPPGSSPWLKTLPPRALSYKSGNDDTDEGNNKPLDMPAYLSKAYFDQLRWILDYSKKRGKKVVFYDEVGYPSGIANHTTPKMYMRQLLEKKEQIVNSGESIQLKIDDSVNVMAIVAMDTTTLKRVDLTYSVHNKILKWTAPNGHWKLMIFNCVRSKASGNELDYRSATDFLDESAVKWFVNKVYQRHADEIGSYFGNTIIQTFFDDVGIFDEEKTWTNRFNKEFKRQTGVEPATFYPALWGNIGIETAAARIAFFNTRAEMLANGFPKIVTEWGRKNHINVSGHCPGNYDPQPVDMNGDPFKFYRAQPVPMVDVIFNYPTGRDGFKLVSDGADYYDKPVVAGETFNSFSPAGKIAGYRRLMELYARGVNRLIGSGLPKNEVKGEAVTTFADWIGRSSLMLQGGRRVSKIAVFYPIADLEGFFRFDAPEYGKNSRWGTFVPYDNDYLAVGEMLLGEVHRDFTFIHPDFLVSSKIKIRNAQLVLGNRINRQQYDAIIMPGETVISLRALRKIKAYYDAGGVILATSRLPSRSSELAGNPLKTAENDRAVQTIISEIFGINSSLPMPEGISAIKRNRNNGRAVFISKPDGKSLGEVMEKLNLIADVRFCSNPSPSSGGGMFSYIHKQKNRKDIYYFANSTDDSVKTIAEVKGRVKPEIWNPLNGKITPMVEYHFVKKKGVDYTQFRLDLEPVKSTFIVSESARTKWKTN